MPSIDGRARFDALVGRSTAGARIHGSVKSLRGRAVHRPVSCGDRISRCVSAVVLQCIIQNEGTGCSCSPERTSSVLLQVVASCAQDLLPANNDFARGS